MKARIPKGMGGGPGNMQSMVRQAQKMQEEMQEKQEQLAQQNFSVSVGGGAVSITMNGKKEVQELVIQPDVVDPEDIDMLQDLIVSAVNECIRKVEDTTNAVMEKITGGMSMPGLF